MTYIPANLNRSTGFFMKSIIVLSFMFFFTMNAFAQKEVMAPGYYAVKYEVTGTSPLCPEGMVCVTNGTIVHLTATLDGCFDKVVFTEFKTNQTNKKATIHALGIAKVDPRSLKTACFVPAMDKRSVTLINFYSEDIQVINSELENR